MGCVLSLASSETWWCRGFWEESGALNVHSVKCMVKRMTICISPKSPELFLHHQSLSGADSALDQRNANPHDLPCCMQWAIKSLLVLMLVGCASDNERNAKSALARNAQALQLQRENSLQSAWVGKRYDSLLEAFGEPKLHMNILGYRPLKTSLAVYGVLDASANCVDAFTMVKIEDTGEWVVADYFCR